MHARASGRERGMAAVSIARVRASSRGRRRMQACARPRLISGVASSSACACESRKIFNAHSSYMHARSLQVREKGRRRSLTLLTLVAVVVVVVVVVVAAAAAVVAVAVAAVAARRSPSLSPPLSPRSGRVTTFTPHKASPLDASSRRRKATPRTAPSFNTRVVDKKKNDASRLAQRKSRLAFRLMSSSCSSSIDLGIDLDEQVGERLASGWRL